MIKPEMRERYLLFTFIGVIIPTTLFLIASFFVLQIWQLHSDVTIDGLQSKRFLSAPLLEIMGDEENSKKEIPQWIEFVSMKDGTVLYPYDENSVPLSLEKLYINLFDEQAGSPDEIGLVTFTYKGEKGICYFVNRGLPFLLKILLKPRYLTYVFLITTLIFIIGTLMVVKLKNNADELTTAIGRLERLDFSTPLKPKKKNRFLDIFQAFEKMRLEMMRQRKQATLLFMAITHDLKTPLTSIRGYLEMCRDDVVETEEERKEIIERSLKKTSLLEERINELLDFSRTLFADFDLKRDRITLIKFIENLNSYFEEDSKLYKKKYIFSSTIKEDQPLQICEKQLTRAVINLFDNACRYTEVGDTIRFSCSNDRERGSVTLTMDDSGKGVDPKDRERIFDLFFRKDRGRNTRGMGIGLTSVKIITELHGGTVSCTESDLGGASFQITLPSDK